MKSIGNETLRLLFEMYIKCCRKAGVPEMEIGEEIGRVKEQCRLIVDKVRKVKVSK